MEEWEPVDRDHVVKFFQIINQQSHQTMVSFRNWEKISFYAGHRPKFGAISRTVTSTTSRDRRARNHYFV